MIVISDKNQSERSAGPLVMDVERKTNLRNYLSSRASAFPGRKGAQSSFSVILVHAAASKREVDKALELDDMILFCSR